MTATLYHFAARIPRFYYLKKHLYALQSGRSIVTHISSTTSLLRSDSTDNEVYLLGTAHVSEASTKEVIDLIHLVKPQTVFVELDSTRAAQLRNSSSSSDSAKNNESASPSFDLSKITSHPLFSQFGNKTGLPNNFTQILEHAPTLLKKIGWFPQQGGEMKAALEEADRIGARCIYGDIEFTQTMNEMKMAIGSIIANPTALSNLQYPSGDVMSIFGGLLSGQSDPQQFVEMIKTRERSQQITRYLQQSFPSVYNVMITKRDVHMARMLRQHCSDGKVVAIVGLAHVEGIEREWEELGKQQRIAS